MRRITIQTLIKAVAAAAVAVTACGGNGGEGVPSVMYSGATTPAAVTSGNALALASTAYDGGNSGGALALVGVAGHRTDGSAAGASRALTVSRALTNAARAARLGVPSSPNVAIGAATSGSLPAGNCGGSAAYSGTADQTTGAFHATFRFTAWCNDGVTVSGSVTAAGQVDLNSQQLASLEFSFAVLTVSDGASTFRGRGTISAAFGASDVLTINMDFASGDGTIYRASNLTLEVTATGSGEDVSVVGRVYHPLHGYVDVSTPQPLVTAAGDDYPSSGALVVTGAGNASARLTVLSATTFQIDVDADGDSVYETTVGAFTWGTLEPAV
jgi:hypothetical protein